MSKRRVVALVLSLSLFLSACGTMEGTSISGDPSDPDTQELPDLTASLVETSAVAADFEQTMADIGAGKYPNLTGTVRSPKPDVTEISVVELLCEERYSTFQEFAAAAEEFFGQFQECEPEFVFVPKTDGQAGVSTSLESIRQNGTESNYNDTQALLFRGNYPAGEMQFPRNLIANWTNRGVIAQLNSDLQPHPGIHTYGGTVYDFRTGASTDTVITLQGTEISFADAIAVFDREINQTYFLPEPNEELTYQVHSIVVCDVTDSAQALKMMCRPVYHGIPFDELYGEGGTVRDVPGVSSYNLTGIAMANAMMISPDTLDATVNIGRVRRTVSDAPISKLLPVSTAVQMLSNQLTTATTFTVDCAELVYIADPASEAGTDAVTMRPAWKLRLINPNNNARYSYYVDVVTGELTAMEELA